MKLIPVTPSSCPVPILLPVYLFTEREVKQQRARADHNAFIDINIPISHYILPCHVVIIIIMLYNDMNYTMCKYP